MSKQILILQKVVGFIMMVPGCIVVINYMVELAAGALEELGTLMAQPLTENTILGIFLIQGLVGASLFITAVQKIEDSKEHGN